MIDLFKNVIQKACIKAIVACSDFMNNVPDHLKTQEMYIRAVEIPDHFKTRKMCDNVVWRHPYYLQFIPDNLKMQGMCEKVVKDNPWCLIDVQEHLKTKKMCEKSS